MKLHAPRFWPALLAVSVALAIAGCGGGGGGGSPPPDPGIQGNGDGALAASKPGELLAFIQAKLRERQAQRLSYPDAVFVTGIASGAPAAAAAGAAATAPATGVERSGTTVQEQGVDEDDLIKTDGSMIYTLVRSSATGTATSAVQAYRRLAGGALEATGSVKLAPEADGYAMGQGMYLAAAAQRVAVLGSIQAAYTVDICAGVALCPLSTLLPSPPRWTRETVLLDLVSVANPSAPAALERIRIDGRLVGSRLIGNALYLVTQHTPQLALEALPADAPAAQRDALIAKLTPADLLPRIQVGAGASATLLPETDCYVQAKNASPGIEITTITVFDLQSSTLNRSSRCIVGGTEALYMSSANLYLATTRYAYDTGAAALRFAPQTSTDLHKFALNGQLIEYRGSGSVDGHLGWNWEQRSYRMGEWGGDLRVLTFTGETGWGPVNSLDGTTAPSPATLSILRERASDKTLQLVSRLPNAARPQALGKTGEQVYAVRFLGDRGYVVTFRRSDPLYVLDLANPADPRTAGELVINGFSDYLFPITEGLLLGVGRDATDTGVTSGVKVALFDVADPAKPTQLASRTFGDRGSSSGLDVSRHGIDIFTRAGVSRVALPLAMPGAAGVTQRGLQRLEIDTAARTMVLRPMLGNTATAPYVDISADRSVQIDAQVYYFSDGQLAGYDW